MRAPSLKLWLIFTAGFTSCLACIVVLIFSAYFFWFKPMVSNTVSVLSSNLSPPEFFAPQPAVLDLTAVGKNGTSLNLQTFRGKVIVLNVWATWCPPCMAELPSLGRLAAHYAATNGVAVICLSEEPAGTIFKNHGALDSGAPIFSLNGCQLPAIYNTDAIPATFVIDPHGMLVFKHVGSANWSDPSVTKFIDSLRP